MTTKWENPTHEDIMQFIYFLNWQEKILVEMYVENKNSVIRDKLLLIDFVREHLIKKHVGTENSGN